MTAQDGREALRDYIGCVATMVAAVVAVVAIVVLAVTLT